MARADHAGVRDAVVFGASCAQNPQFIHVLGVIAKEDCLYLNVWTPDWPSRSKKPVMVWVPGGGNYFGSGSTPTLDGESLARHGVIVVTLNYRLGNLGFFSHPTLTRESAHHASGNQGILDQIAALRWVRDNIAKFGGDPRNVTIFGESAGSLDVSVLMTTSLSRGLFKRGIGESGSVRRSSSYRPISTILNGTTAWNSSSSRSGSASPAWSFRATGRSPSRVYHADRPR